MGMREREKESKKARQETWTEVMKRRGRITMGQYEESPERVTGI
jgi:hypothetical protein